MLWKIDERRMNRLYVAALEGMSTNRALMLPYYESFPSNNVCLLTRHIKLVKSVIFSRENFIRMLMIVMVLYIDDH